MDAASAASAAPRVNTSTKSSRLPAPPDAITGMDTACDTAAVISQSGPHLRAVAIDRGQEDLACSALFGLKRPLDGVARGGHLSAARVHGESMSGMLRVDGDNHRLAAVGSRGW